MPKFCNLHQYIFAALESRLRLVMVPLRIFGVTIGLLRLLPRFYHLTMEMAKRMNRDVVFDHADALRDLNVSPRPFVLSSADCRNTRDISEIHEFDRAD